MSFYLLSARFAQAIGLVAALAFAAIWLGTRMALPLASDLSRAFIAAGGTPRDLFFGAGIGFFIFVGVTLVFAVIGDTSSLDKNLRDLRKSGWE